MSANVRVLIAEHSAFCAEARSKLCSAWAVAAVPLLLSQVRAALDIRFAILHVMQICLVSCGAMFGYSCRRRHRRNWQAAPIFDG
jgi:hypothetical protein